jgi:hypothetical protein
MNRKYARQLPLLTAVLTAACAVWLWAGSPSDLPPQASIGIPQAPLARRKAALFDSDLGPDTVNVSGYPARQKRNYKAYVRVCSRCHTLARSINAPYVNRGWWEFYITNMRMRSRRRGESLEEGDIDAVLDFLEYDSNERKVARAAEFGEIRFELKRRFADALDERVKDLLDLPPSKTKP